MPENTSRKAVAIRKSRTLNPVLGSDVRVGMFSICVLLYIVTFEQVLAVPRFTRPSTSFSLSTSANRLQQVSRPMSRHYSTRRCPHSCSVNAFWRI